MAAKKVNPLVEELKAKFEGLTARKIGNSLQVVRQQKAAIAKEKDMLKGIRKNYSNGEFDFQLSARATVWASKGSFTVDELVSVLQGLLKDGEDGFFNRRQMVRLLSGWESMYDAIVQIDADTYEYRASNKKVS